MSIVHQVRHWSASHHPRWLVVLRVGLGLCLFIKGISFMSNAVYLERAVSDSVIHGAINWLPIFITCVHLLGGFLIIIGLFTRLAALVQIPILIGAIIYISSHRGQFAGADELLFAAVVLILLLFFLVEGSGPLSVEQYSRRHQI